MKVAVINFSGNVGKSTLSRYLLAPRMNNAVVIAIESINSDDTQEEAYKGKQFGKLQKSLAVVDDAVIDIGASNVEDFIQQMKQYKGSHEDIDFFVVPTVQNNKQQRDTITTINALNEIGVEKNKIRLVFNMTEHDDDIESNFSGLFEYYAQTNSFVINKEAVIQDNELYELIKNSQQTISDILNDSTDYKEKIKTATHPSEKIEFAQRLAIRRLASGVNEELDNVFRVLLG